MKQAVVAIRFLAIIGCLTMALPGCEESQEAKNRRLQQDQEREQTRLRQVAKRDQDLFAAQIASNSQILTFGTPSTANAAHWMQDPGWGSHHVGQGALIAVELNDALFDAAVRSWRSTTKVSDQDRIAAAAHDLKRRFSRPAAKAFLLLAPPISAGSYPEWWSYSLRDLSSGLHLVPFNGVPVAPQEIEPCSEQMKFVRRVQTCIAFFPDRVTRTDPRYRLRLDGIEFFVLSSNQKHWIPSKVGTGMLAFTFEASEIRLVRMIESSVGWEAIEDTYVKSHRDAVATKFGDWAAKFLFEVAVKVVSGLIMRSIG